MDKMISFMICIFYSNNDIVLAKKFIQIFPEDVLENPQMKFLANQIKITVEVGPCQQGVSSNCPVEDSTRIKHAEEYEFHWDYDFNKWALHFWTAEVDTHKLLVESQKKLWGPQVPTILPSG